MIKQLFDRQARLPARLATRRDLPGDGGDGSHETPLPRRPAVGVTRRVVRRISDLPSLLRATNCPDLEALTDQVVNSLKTDYPDLEVEDDVTNGDIVLRWGTRGAPLAYPFALAEFWELVDYVDGQLDWESTRDELLFSDGRETAGLAKFFDVSTRQLTRQVGGGWRRIDGSHLTGRNEREMVWFVTGDPIAVMLGVGIEWATVSVPAPWRRYSELAPLEYSSCVDIELRTAGTLQQLASALASARAAK